VETDKYITRPEKIIQGLEGIDDYQRKIDCSRPCGLLPYIIILGKVEDIHFIPTSHVVTFL